MVKEVFQFEQIMKNIREKKELQHLDDYFLEKILRKYSGSHPGALKIIETGNTRSSKYKQIVKDIRAHLREIYGVFQVNTNRDKLLQNYKEARGTGQQLKALNNLLESHKSTQERATYYPELYKELFAITGKPERILDIGCGFNPLSYRWLGCEPHYEATDISCADMLIIQKFFEANDYDGKFFVCDVLDEEQRKLFKEADIVFMFKLVDTLESQRRNITKDILPHLKCKHIIVSFPTISIGGKKMREGGKENWFSRWLDSQGWKWQTHTIPGEEFWIITKI